VPELPEVETVRRGLRPVMVGERFTKVEVRQPRLRWPLPHDFARRLEGNTVTGLHRRAKYLLGDLSSGEVLLMHLGMSGSFRVGKHVATRPGRFHHERSNDLAHDHVVFHMSSGARIAFNDPRRFGFMKLLPRDRLADDPLMRALGPEPLDGGFDATVLARTCAGRKTSLKAALSDQKVIAGLGNIYVCEALYRARIHPKRAAGSVSLERLERLVAAIKDVLAEAIEAGGSTLRDFISPDGELGYFSKTFSVYDREGLPCGCGGTVRRFVQGGRSTFYCPACQR
jgi:formamidopyrimidine-DNA glycosylase